MRVKNQMVDIDEMQTSNFWEKRAEKGLNLKTVLLNEELDDKILQKRNTKEFNIVRDAMPQNPTIIDIGCGIGRWADNLKGSFLYYQGIDYTESLIAIARQRFEDFSNTDFINMSASNLDKSKLRASYSMAIITGVLMYINDKDISGLLDFINYAVTDTIYIQESICNDTRLTLDNIFSESLNDNYSAIYRTKEEYELLFANKLKNFVITKTDLLLDGDMAPHKETNAMYWILKRI